MPYHKNELDPEEWPAIWIGAALFLLFWWAMCNSDELGSLPERPADRPSAVQLDPRHP